jgi:hypothetical protein
MESHGEVQVQQYLTIRMTSSGMLSRVALVTTDVSEERRFYIPEDGILHSHRHESLKSSVKVVLHFNTFPLFNAHISQVVPSPLV